MMTKLLEVNYYNDVFRIMGDDFSIAKDGSMDSKETVVYKNGFETADFGENFKGHNFDAYDVLEKLLSACTLLEKELTVYYMDRQLRKFITDKMADRTEIPNPNFRAIGYPSKILIPHNLATAELKMIFEDASTNKRMLYYEEIGDTSIALVNATTMSIINDNYDEFTNTLCEAVKKDEINFLYATESTREWLSNYDIVPNC